MILALVAHNDSLPQMLILRFHRISSHQAPRHIEVQIRFVFVLLPLALQDCYDNRVRSRHQGALGLKRRKVRVFARGSLSHLALEASSSNNDVCPVLIMVSLLPFALLQMNPGVLYRDGHNKKKRGGRKTSANFHWRSDPPADGSSLSRRAVESTITEASGGDSKATAAPC